ncbi:MAG TPA: M15 family metallopeptidase [Candidatus Paceibacterota bacterium]|nr:M15 family metallopeptidase [Candidatus Paceibacterota bacterium]HMP18822.1 M15 family metallopeptidase [Candidatus Paceibacterota bacterium]HMP85543.1 M15 family metallopeptidase [Candidatus Paceibacterota bacterium]
MLSKFQKINVFSEIIIFVIIILSIIYIIFTQTNNKKEITSLNEKINSQNESLSEKITNIENILIEATDQNLSIKEALEQAEKKSESLSKQFDRVNRNVGELEKITKTDKELLQKYSKVYFLNEHYRPADLKNIKPEFTFNRQREYQIHYEVWPYLQSLLEDAKDDGLNLLVISAFRSFQDQAILKGNYVVTYGAGTANQFSADQGYSEHQLGTAVDFTTPIVGATFSGFEKTKEYDWLTKNAHKYGFILSYPPNNKYYQYEPWHWRFVGVRLATDLYKDKKYFYDLSQREIDEYIIYLFD